METVKEVTYDADGNIMSTKHIQVPNASSVVIKMTAKGEMTPEVKVYSLDPDKAANKAMELMRRIVSEMRNRY